MKINLITDIEKIQLDKKYLYKTGGDFYKVVFTNMPKGAREYYIPINYRRLRFNGVVRYYDEYTSTGSLDKSNMLSGSNRLFEIV